MEQRELMSSSKGIRKEACISRGGSSERCNGLRGLYSELSQMQAYSYREKNIGPAALSYLVGTRLVNAVEIAGALKLRGLERVLRKRFVNLIGPKDEPSSIAGLIDYRHFTRGVIQELTTTLAKSSGLEKEFIEEWMERLRGQSLNRHRWERIDSTLPKFDLQLRSTPLNSEFTSAYGDNYFKQYALTGNASVNTNVDLQHHLTPSRPVNAWVSEVNLLRSGKTLLSFIRMGSIASPIETDLIKQRENGLERARELLRASFVKRLSSMSDGEREETLAMQEIPHRVVVVDLQTPNEMENSPNVEPAMVAEQRAVFNELSNSVLAIDLELSDKSRAIYLRPEFCTFNVPANWRHYDEDSDLQPRAIEDARKGMKRLAKWDSPQGGCLNSRAKLLLGQIEEILNKGLDSDDWREPLKLQSRLVNYGYHIADDVFVNCKAGKDRTGQLGLEATLLAAQLEEAVEGSSSLPVPGARLSARDSQLLNELVLQNGGLEIQQLNCGVRGYMLAPRRPSQMENDCIIQRFGGLESWEVVIGGSRLAYI